MFTLYSLNMICKRFKEKNDFMNLDWSKHQFYALGRNIQDIANEQGVSMITIRKWLDKLENASKDLANKK
ncbi:hypothetical protein ES703_103958 [subsurface metagenome]